MDDSFNFGEKAKRPARLASPRRATAAAAGLQRAIVGALIALALGVAVFAVMRLMGDAGKQAADAQRKAVDQIAVANDVAAEQAARSTAFSAAALLAETGAYPTAEQLEPFDPALRYTSSASDGPKVVSVAASGSGFAGAVRSDSGACLWFRMDLGGVTTYGRGEPCTGQAAMAARDPGW